MKLTPQQQHFWLVCKRGTLFVCLSFYVLVLYAGWCVYTFAKIDETQSADAAIVLGAGIFGNRPSPVLRARIDHAIQLYQDGYVSIIIFTGGASHINAPTEAEVAQQYAIAQGIPKTATRVETSSKNTWENLTYAQMLATDAGWSTFLIVSTPFHMKRAIGIADNLNMTAYTSPTHTIQWLAWHTKLRAYLREVGGYTLFLIMPRQKS